MPNRDLAVLALRLAANVAVVVDPPVADASIVRTMNSLLAHLLAAMLADSAGQLAGTPPGAQPTIAERATVVRV